MKKDLPIKHKLDYVFSYAYEGTYLIPYKGVSLVCIVSASRGWDHVSVSVRDKYGRKTIKRVPSWEEMCAIKDMFFEPEEWVVQYHPAQSEYVNKFPYALHMWRPQDVVLPVPPKELV